MCIRDSICRCCHHDNRISAATGHHRTRPYLSTDGTARSANRNRIGVQPGNAHSASGANRR